MKSGSQHSQTSIGVGKKGSKPQRNIYGIKEDILNEEAMAALGQDVLDSSCYHHIAAITDAHESHDDILSSSLDLDLRDPFDQQVNCKFLETIKPPLCEYPSYVAFDFDLDPIIPGNTIIMGDLSMYIAKCIGEGGYAKIFEVSLPQINYDDTATGPTNIENQVLKFQQPACYWEFYVSCELRRRLSLHKSSMNIIPSIMQIDRGCFYKNASVLQMKLIPWGSLLNLVNFYRKDHMKLSQVEPFACLLTIELLHMFEQIHKCQIIHGDVKPDNFLLLDIPDVKKSKDPKEVFGNKLRIVQLIDFGQSIDLTKFSDGTTFRASVKTSGFQCIEMRTQRPWTFQTDLFGLAGTIHVVLFGSYMNVFQENGLWKITGNYVRKWNVQLWKKFFHELLNIPSCHQQPDLAAMRQTFEDYFIESCIPQYNKWAQHIRGSEDLWSAREII
ncbi:unnamed protein product [Lymnaea stagnalis]|uniref:Protein kinase domain-containing protein n=1 Tax=Lymnaea stagnalis TaxID=6523 RepID=A0AAV2HTH7_LYMST